MSITTQRREYGFSLIELLIGVALLGVLIGLALPSFSEWMRNTRLRNQADSVLSGIQLARAEAVRRNAFVRFQLVSANADLNMDNTCDVVDTSTPGANLWVVSQGDPTDACGGDLLAIDNTAPVGPKPVALYEAAPNLLVKGIREGRQDEMETQVVLYRMVNGAPPTWPIFSPDEGAAICFSPTGKLAQYETATGRCTVSRNPGTTWIVRASINFDPPAGSGLPDCAPAGSTRCLRITVGAGGEARLCDRAATNAADPRRCPW